METLEALGHQIQSIEDLGAIVKTMKGLAAVNIRQYEEAAVALKEYNRTLELGLRVLLQDSSSSSRVFSDDSRGPLAVVVLGSDQGMCGQFNSRIVSHVRKRLKQLPSTLPPPLVLAIGIRVVDEMESTSHGVTTSFHLPSSVMEITRRAQDMLLILDQWREEHDIRRVWLFHQHPLSGASYEPRFVQVVPFSQEWIQSIRSKPWPTRMLPSYSMDWGTLFSSLIRQSLFGAFYRGLAESLAAENAARLAAMQAAEKNIEERHDDLSARYHQQRQNAITAELLDLTAQLEVLGHHDT